jgi:hypothetical protein
MVIVLEPYFKPWISDEEPKAPEGWGIDVLRSTYYVCAGCQEQVKPRDEYVYRFQREGVTVIHNRADCWFKYVEKTSD